MAKYVIPSLAISALKFKLSTIVKDKKSASDINQFIDIALRKDMDEGMMIAKLAKIFGKEQAGKVVKATMELRKTGITCESIMIVLRTLGIPDNYLNIVEIELQQMVSDLDLDTFAVDANQNQIPNDIDSISKNVVNDFLVPKFG
jgi:hypothetical protein